MFPAARIGDPVTHDMVVPSGVIAPPRQGRPINVFIEGLPAAVQSDWVTCTGATVASLAHLPQAGPPPAVPPSVPIVKGSLTVMINGLPAARWIADPSGCGALIGDLNLLKNRRVFIGDIGGGPAAGTAGAGVEGPAAKVMEAYTEDRLTSVGSVPSTQVGPLESKEDKEKEKTWIGIVLKDFDGTPIPDQDFQITLDGGQTLSGRTDAKGYARFEKVNPDQGEVAFVNIPEEKEVIAERKKKAEAATRAADSSGEGSQTTEGREAAETRVPSEGHPVEDSFKKPDSEEEDLD